VTVYEQSLKRPFSLKEGNRLLDRNLLFVDVNIVLIVAKYDMRNLRLLGGRLRLFGLQQVTSKLTCFGVDPNLYKLTRTCFLSYVAVVVCEALNWSSLGLTCKAHKCVLKN
jgi:hypothetical protein